MKLDYYKLLSNLLESNSNSLSIHLYNSLIVTKILDKNQQEIFCRNIPQPKQLQNINVHCNQGAKDMLEFLITKSLFNITKDEAFT